MNIGIDFDNTIISYDEVFHQVALEQGLIPLTIPVNKTAVRDYLRGNGHEHSWTAMQGYVYGTRLPDARMFPGVKNFFFAAADAGHALFIVSHKTRLPLQGPPYDLHEAARSWIVQSGLLDPETGMTQKDLFFEVTKEGKMKRIEDLQCAMFIDDLPELLQDKAFPDHVQKFLFDPYNLQRSFMLPKQITTVTSWKALEAYL